MVQGVALSYSACEVPVTNFDSIVSHHRTVITLLHTAAHCTPMGDDLFFGGSSPIAAHWTLLHTARCTLLHTINADDHNNMIVSSFPSQKGPSSIFHRNRCKH